MIILGGRLIRSFIPFYAFGLLLLTVCPLLFPKSGEQQYSYVQGLCFLSFAWMALTFQIQNCKRAMVIRSMDMAIGACLLALLLHIFWIRPVSLSIWRWVDAAGLFAFYVFVRQSSSKGIKIFLACVMMSGLFQCFYAGMQGMGLLPSLHNAFPMTGSFLNPAPLAGYLAVLTSMGMVGLFCTDGFHGKLRIVAVIGLLLFGSFVFLFNLYFVLDAASIFNEMVCLKVISSRALSIVSKVCFFKRSSTFSLNISFLRSAIISSFFSSVASRSR